MMTRQILLSHQVRQQDPTGKMLHFVNMYLIFSVDGPRIDSVFVSRAPCQISEKAENHTSALWFDAYI